jgi:hypothetical protein
MLHHQTPHHPHPTLLCCPFSPAAVLAG